MPSKIAFFCLKQHIVNHFWAIDIWSGRFLIWASRHSSFSCCFQTHSFRNHSSSFVEEFRKQRPIGGFLFQQFLFFLVKHFFAFWSCSFTSVSFSESTLPSILSGIPKTLSRKIFCDLASLIPVSRSFSLQLLWKWRIHLKWVAIGSSVFQAQNCSSSPSVMKPFPTVNPLQLLTQADANTFYV